MHTLDRVTTGRIQRGRVLLSLWSMSAGRTLRSQQLDGITRMLELGRAAERGRAWQDPWKVLVYDSFCRDIISPLLKV